MADLVVKLQGQDNLSGTLNLVKQNLNSMSESTSKLDKILQRFARIELSTAPLKKKLADIKSLMSQLNLSGDSNSPLYNQMALAAGAYTDAIADAAAATKAFASDTSSLDASLQALQGVTAAATVATGAMGLFGVENENVEQCILKVLSAMAILNGVQTISNVLNKDSVLIQKLRALATTGETVTTTTFTAALSKHAIVEALATAKTKISTVAQTAWNVAKAIGMAMLGNFTGLALVAVGAVVGLAVATKKDTEETEKNNAVKSEAALKAEEVAKAQQKAYETTRSEEAKVIASYKAMQTQWNALTNDVEKAKWLQDNKSKFEQMGVSIDDTTKAEEFFVKQSSAVIASLKARAEAAARYNLLVEALQDKYRADGKQTFEQYTKDGKYYFEGDKNEAAYDTKEERQRAIHEQVVADRAAKDQIVDEYTSAWLDSLKRADQVAATLKVFEPKKTDKKTSSSSSQKKLLKESDDDNSLKFASDMVSQIQDRIKTIDVNATVELEAAKSDLEKWRKEEQRRKLIIYPDPELDENSLEYAQDMLLKSQDALKSLDLANISDEDLNKALAQVDQWVKEVENREIKLGIKTVEPEESVASIVAPESDKFFAKGSTEDMRLSLANSQSIVERIKSDYSSDLIDVDTAKQQLAELNKQLEELGLKPIELYVNSEGIQSAEEAMQTYADKMNEVGSLAGTVGDVFNNLGSAIGGTAGAMLDFAGLSAQAVAQIIPQIVALMGAKEGEALASGTASAASLPFPANIAAIASIVATITGLFASFAGKFADGGIIGGSSYHGDQLIARVNSGEMILNQRQQSNLFNALNSGGGVGGRDVHFTISGSNLKGCLKNYETKTSKYK